MWDRLTDGLPEAVPVTIWNSSGVALASATVPGGTAAGEINEYLYVKLATPVILPADNYTIAGYVGDYGVSTLYQQASINPAPGITYGYPVEAGGNVYPSGHAPNTTGSSAFFGPNFQFTTIAAPAPEPSTWALFAVGALGLGVVTLRRRVARA